MIKGIHLITNISKEAFSAQRAVKAMSSGGLRYSRAVEDVVQIRNKTPLAEFKNYIEGFKLEGEAFIPKSGNPSSTFMEYFFA